MGLVLHARHLRLEENVAIKILLPAMLEVPGMVMRFLREARAASKIKSRHVVRVTDVDVLEDGVPYMVMEYLEGISIAALRRREGKFSIADATRFILEACDAIAEAHTLGIVHRDLKPANLFLARGRDGASTVKVLDFGISKVDAPGEQDTTKTGQMMGSPKYMAPEQMLSMHDVDGRADIWSLGAILYDMLTGRTPFVADTVPQLCSAVLNDRPPPPRNFRPDLPEALEAAVMRCLQRERTARFVDVGAFAAAIAPFAPEESASSELRRAALKTAASNPDVGVDGVPTVSVAPGEARSGHPSHSVPPQSGTIAGWNAATPVKRSKRATVVAAVVGLVAIASGTVLLRVRRPAPTVAEAQAASTGATTRDPVAAPEPPKPPTATKSADPEAAPSDLPTAAPPSAAPSSVATTPPRIASPASPSAVSAAPHAPTKRTARGGPADSAPPDGDPFGGKRR
jgi:serine/threonine-protein kinase